MASQQQAQPEREQAIARLLACRYGDGGVYIPRYARQPGTLQEAIAAGFISADGFVTRKGRRLLARLDF